MLEPEKFSSQNQGHQVSLVVPYLGCRGWLKTSFYGVGGFDGALLVVRWADFVNL